MEDIDKSELGFNLDSSLKVEIEEEGKLGLSQRLELRKSMVEKLIKEALNVDWTLEKLVETVNFLALIGLDEANRLKQNADQKALKWRLKWLDFVHSNYTKEQRDIEQQEYSEYHYLMNLLTAVLKHVCGYFGLVGPNVIPYRNMAESLIKRLKKTRDEDTPMIAKEFVEEWGRKRGYKAEVVKAVVYATIKFYYYFYTYLLPKEKRKT